jgi:hypothetical protein
LYKFTDVSEVLAHSTTIALMMTAASMMLTPRKQPSLHSKKTMDIQMYAPEQRNTAYRRYTVPTTTTKTAASEKLLDQRREEQKGKWSAFYTVDGGFPHPKT